MACERSKRVPPDSKEIVAGSRVRIKSFTGWYVVISISGNQVECQRNIRGETSTTWTNFDWIDEVSNKPTKGKKA